MGAGAKRDFKECGLARVEKYMALRKPGCNGGAGCNRCWNKYNSKAAKDFRLRRAYGGRKVRA